MHLFRRNTIATVLLLFWGVSASAADTRLNDSGEPQGWHFYHEKTEPEKAPVEPSTPTPAATPQAPTTKPLSAKWIRENFEQFLFEALDEPSPENIRRVRYVQRMMNDSASNFTDAFVQDVISNPYLDETSARPTSQFGIAAKTSEMRAARGPVLDKIGQQAGFWFFFQSDCDNCLRQSKIIERLNSVYHFDVQAVSIDGMPLSNGLFPDYTTDSKGIYKDLNIIRTPALLLVSKNGSFYSPITQGIATESEVLDVTMIQAKTHGLITQEEHDRASAVSSMKRLAAFGNVDAERAMHDADYLVEILEAQLQ